MKSVKMRFLRQKEQQQLSEQNAEIDKIMEEKKNNFTEDELELELDITQSPVTMPQIDYSYSEDFFNIELEMAKLPNRKKVWCIF